MTQEHDADMPLQLGDLGELHKVLPAGGPVLTAGRCPKCNLPAGAGQPGNCPAMECDIGSCPLRSGA